MNGLHHISILNSKILSIAATKKEISRPTKIRPKGTREKGLNLMDLLNAAIAALLVEFVIMIFLSLYAIYFRAP